MSTVKTIKNVKIKKIEKTIGHIKYINIINDEYSGSEIENLNLTIEDEEVVEVSLNGLNVGFDIKTTTYCCGLLELGELSCDLQIAPIELTKLLDYCVQRVNGKTLMINTNGVGYSKVFEQALAKCKYFKLVKTFINDNSGNTVKIWISNND